MADRLYGNLDIVFKMVGNISPIGETNTDNERFENLKEMCDLVENLLSTLQMMRSEKNRYEYSIKRSGEYVDKFLTSIGLTND